MTRPRIRDTVLGVRIVTPEPYPLLAVRCGRCGAEWETTGRETSRCRACGRVCRLGQAAASVLEDGGRYAKRNMRLAHLGCAGIGDPLLAKALAWALGGDPNAWVRAGEDDETCLQGHRLAGANLLKASDGRRRCRQCRNDRERAASSPAT